MGLPSEWLVKTSTGTTPYVGPKSEATSDGPVLAPCEVDCEGRTGANNIYGTRRYGPNFRRKAMEGLTIRRQEHDGALQGFGAERRNRSEDRFGRFRLEVREVVRANRRAIRLCRHNRECKRNRSLPSPEARWNWQGD